jgi:hypothetical protein
MLSRASAFLGLALGLIDFNVFASHVDANLRVNSGNLDTGFDETEIAVIWFGTSLSSDLDCRSHPSSSSIKTGVGRDGNDIKNTRLFTFMISNTYKSPSGQQKMEASHQFGMDKYIVYIMIHRQSQTILSLLKISSPLQSQPWVLKHEIDQSGQDTRCNSKLHPRTMASQAQLEAWVDM